MTLVSLIIASPLLINFLTFSLSPFPQTGTKGEKVLGLAWSLESDTIHFNFENIQNRTKEAY